MQFSENWLRTFVNPPCSSEELAHLLTMSGLELEEMAPVATAFNNIVVAQVLEVIKHPDADRLRVCQVDAGTGTPLQIVCGAPNVSAGIKVPCALIGATLPVKEGQAPFEIKLAKMRGVESQGMLCSARELNLSEDADGLMILPADAQIGLSLRQHLDLDDQIFTLKLTPNRADCLSLLGVAREVSALTKVALQLPSVLPVAVTSDERLAVKIQAPDLCGRFSSRVIRNINAKAATPEWMKRRLLRSGQRSVNVLVDISNYVMFELGQPSHIFDLAKINGTLEVRWAKPGEKLKLLNEQTVELDAQIGVVADQSGAESLAGMMGGDITAVSLETTDIFIEAAFWWPNAIQGRARRLNFSSEASHRFERGVDGEQTINAIERITRLIIDICSFEQSPKVGPIDDQIMGLPERNKVTLRVARAHKVIGVEIPVSEIEAIFKQLNFAYALNAGAETFSVVAPSYRFDIEREEDLIEELARCYGFDNIPANLPIARHSMLSSHEERRDFHALRQCLVTSDYQEVLNFSFTDESCELDFAGNKDPICLLNPIANQLNVMRSSLMGSLVANVRYNLNRKVDRVRVFEIAKVYLRDAAIKDDVSSVAGVIQPTRIGAIAYGAATEEQWGLSTRLVDFYDVKRDVEALFMPLVPEFVKADHPALHPGRSASIQLNGKLVGWLGEMHPRWMQKYDFNQAPILFECDTEALQSIPLPKSQEISKFPVVTRDLAFIVDVQVEMQSMLTSISDSLQQQNTKSLSCDVKLFDQYRGKGLKDNEKSLAFRFRLQDTQQTLSDDAIDAVLSRVVQQLQTKVGAQVRS